MDKMFTTGEIQKIFPRLKYRTIISWQEAGLIVPTASGKGPGSRRLFDAHEVLLIGIIHELRLLNASRRTIGNFILRTREAIQERSDYAFVLTGPWIVPGNKEYIHIAPGYTLDIPANFYSPCAFVVRVQMIHKRIIKHIQK